MSTTLTARAPADAPIDEWGFGPWLRASADRGELVDLPDLDTVNDAEVAASGRALVNFSGIGILGWQHDRGVRTCFREASERYGLVVGGSRMIQGVAHPHVRLEELLAEITGRAGALTFATGLLANLGFVNAMSARFSFHTGAGVDNADAVFVLDRESHWSMWKAVERLEPGRTLHTFRHNDVAHLRRVLSRVRGRRIVVGFETVYSADGSVAPIGEIQDVCDEFGAVSFADDANGFMVYGGHERRFADEYAALRRVDFLMLSFGKSVGLGGGALVGPHDALRAFRYLSGTSMFTTNIQPPTASAITHVLRRMRDEPSIMGRYLDRVDRFRDGLRAIGCTINPVPSYITSIAVGSDETAAALRRDFLDRGYHVPVFRYPAVRKNRAVVRLLLNDRLSEDHVDGFLATLAELKERHDL